MNDKTVKYQSNGHLSKEYIESLFTEDLPVGWNVELEKIYNNRMGQYLSGFTDYKPTRQKVIDSIKAEFNRLQQILQNK